MNGDLARMDIQPKTGSFRHSRAGGNPDTRSIYLTMLIID